MSTPDSAQRVAIIGASDKPERYAHKALKALQQHGHEPVLVHPRLEEIEGIPVQARMDEIDGPIDTVTLYVNPTLSAGMAKDLITLAPKRVIFNPGTENPDLAAALRPAGIATLEACTLVLLATGQF